MRTGRSWCATVLQLLVQSGHSVRVGAVDATTGKPSTAVDFPTELLIGAIAVT